MAAFPYKDHTGIPLWIWNLDLTWDAMSQSFVEMLKELYIMEIEPKVKKVKEYCSLVSIINSAPVSALCKLLLTL